MRGLFFILLLLSGCGEQQEVECYQDGVIEICTCAADTLCAQQAFFDHGDGTCSIEAGDTADTTSD